jgi:MFS transporter, PPP family, 3-phenylpropionic acid transporter
MIWIMPGERTRTAGISPRTASVLWSESVAAEIVVFVVAGPRVLDRFGPVYAMTVAALAGILRWSVMACTADVTAMVLAEPLHGLSFAFLHLACMRLIGHGHGPYAGGLGALDHIWRPRRRGLRHWLWPIRPPRSRDVA